LSGNPQIIWAAQAGSQQRFMSCPFREVLYEGTRGPGKTDALLMSYAQFVGYGFGAAWRGIIFRETYKQLKDVVAKSQKWFNQIFPNARFNESEYCWKFPEGEQLIFSYMRVAEDYWNYHGHEYPFIGWEELTNWPNQGPYDAMRSCNRSSHADDRMPRWIRSTCNPWGVGHHWVKAKFIDQAPPEEPIREEIHDPLSHEKITLTRCYVHGNWRENKKLMDADPEYIANLQMETDENKKRAWLDGDWNIASGGMFGSYWRKEVHVLEPFRIPASWRIERAFDWGSSKPFSVGWWAVSDGTVATLADGREKKFPRGTYFRINEWYGCKEGRNVPPNVGLEMLSEEIADGIKQREQNMLDGKMITKKPVPGPADSSIFTREDGHSIADGMAKKGIRWIEAEKSPGSRVSGWERIRVLLRACLDEDDHGSVIPRTTPMEEPGLFVFNTCRHWIRTVPVLPRDPDKPDDVDTDAEDHAGDETRYEVFRKKRTGSSQEVQI
jgi:hypothetical protein